MLFNIDLFKMMFYIIACEYFEVFNCSIMKGSYIICANDDYKWER